MAGNIWAVPLALSNFNIVVAVLGGFISLFGLVSYLLKENYYLSEALISLLIGAAFGPHGANFIRPDSYAGCSTSGIIDTDCTGHRLGIITLNFSRLVLGVQLVIAGVQLPSKYLWKERKSLMLLLGPGMICMWLATSLLVWALAGTPNFLHALVIGACVTPTDPVLSAVIVKGKFADNNIPKELQNLIVAESGANDGLGYPFLFFALYLIKYVGSGATSGGAGDAMGLWFAYTWGYTIILSVIYGAVVGLLAKELLRWAMKRNYVDRESFLVSAISLALFVLGTCGLIGTDDVLACFIAGNAFTWDDWFRLETLDDSLQPTIDMLLNVSIFLWYGAYIPWVDFRQNALIPLYKLVSLGLLVLLLRRLPWIFGLHRWIHQIKETHQALFVGFFGPIGVSAVFYLFITLDFIDKFLSDEEGNPRSDVKDLGESVRIVVWFLTVCSVVVHGLSIPLGKMGYLMPRTISRVLSENISSGGDNSRIVSRIPTISRWFSSGKGDVEAAPGMIISEHPLSGTSVSGPSKSRPMLHTIAPGLGVLDVDSLSQEDEMPARRREIRFHDEPEPRPADLVTSGPGPEVSESGSGRSGTLAAKPPAPEPSESKSPDR
ncbi:Sodium/hydrogen exchanger family domain-containing protein [Trichoderma ceciliae]